MEEFPNLNVQRVYLYEYQNSTQDDNYPGGVGAGACSGEDEVATRRTENVTLQGQKKDLLKEKQGNISKEGKEDY